MIRKKIQSQELQARDAVRKAAREIKKEGKEIRKAEREIRKAGRAALAAAENVVKKEKGIADSSYGTDGSPDREKTLGSFTPGGGFPPDPRYRR